MRDQLVALLSRIEVNSRETEGALTERLPPAGYAAPMLLAQATRFGNEIVDAVPYRSSADHGTNFRLLAEALAAIRIPDGFSPFFDEVVAVDPDVETLQRLRWERVLATNMRVSLESGLWTAEDGDGHTRISLAQPLRRSALHLEIESE